MIRVSLRVFVLSCVLLAAITLAACVESGPPTEPPSIRGTIVSVETAGDDGASLLVEGQLESDTQYDRAYVRVDSATRIYDAQGRAIATGELSTGVRVEVWFTGAVAESYPVQATAGAVKLLE